MDKKEVSGMNGNPNAPYYLKLGNLVSNLHSLECFLRLFLGKMDKDRYPNNAQEDSVFTKSAGDIVPEDYLTNYDDLERLLNNYNRIVTLLDRASLRIPGHLVGLRDCIAHGRVLGLEPGIWSQQLWKFRRPRDGKAKVDCVYDLTEANMNVFIDHVFKAAMRVHEACRLFCPEVMPD